MMDGLTEAAARFTRRLSGRVEKGAGSAKTVRCRSSHEGRWKEGGGGQSKRKGRQRRSGSH